MTGTYPDAGDTYVAAVGRLVRVAREWAGLTQTMLEREAGLRPATVYRLERGLHDVEVCELHRIARALGVRLVDLIPPADDPVGNRPQ